MRRQIMFTFALVVVFTMIGGLGLDRMLARILGFHSGWISGALIGATAAVAIIVANQVLRVRGGR